MVSLHTQQGENAPYIFCGIQRRYLLQEIPSLEIPESSYSIQQWEYSRHGMVFPLCRCLSSGRKCLQSSGRARHSERCVGTFTVAALAKLHAKCEHVSFMGAVCNHFTGDSKCPKIGRLALCSQPALLHHGRTEMHSPAVQNVRCSCVSTRLLQDVCHKRLTGLSVSGLGCKHGMKVDRTRAVGVVGCRSCWLMTPSFTAALASDSTEREHCTG